MNALRKLIALLLLAMTSTTAFAVTDAQVFAYAEANYPSIFTGTATAGQYQQYNYRYYPASGNYLAVDTSGEIFILGPYTGDVITSVGPVTAYASTITAWEATQAGTIDTFIYFKRYGSTTPQTATATFSPGSATGTLNIDGQTIPGIYYVSGYGGTVCLAGGTGNTLTSCSSPPDTPQTMLLCGPDPVTGVDGTLLYVLFNSPDANRVSASVTSLMNALQSDHNYLGIGVYSDCSGYAYTAWIRNYPATNYYRWPDVFTTYDSSYLSGVNGLLTTAAAVIYSTPTATNNYKQYVVVRSGGSYFEVWH